MKYLNRAILVLKNNSDMLYEASFRLACLYGSGAFLMSAWNDPKPIVASFCAGAFFLAGAVSSKK